MHRMFYSGLKILPVLPILCCYSYFPIYYECFEINNGTQERIVLRVNDDLYSKLHCTEEKKLSAKLNLL